MFLHRAAAPAEIDPLIQYKVGVVREDQRESLLGMYADDGLNPTIRWVEARHKGINLRIAAGKEAVRSYLGLEEDNKKGLAIAVGTVAVGLIAFGATQLQTHDREQRLNPIVTTTTQDQCLVQTAEVIRIEPSLAAQHSSLLENCYNGIPPAVALASNPESTTSTIG